jgi:hypothetical protein
MRTELITRDWPKSETRVSVILLTLLHGIASLSHDLKVDQQLEACTRIMTRRRAAMVPTSYITKWVEGSSTLEKYTAGHDLSR